MNALREQQEEILNSANITTNDVFDCISQDTILSKISSCHEDKLYLCLGNIGYKLSKFVKDIDITHPGLALLFSGQLVSSKSNSFNKISLDLLKLFDFPLVEFIKSNIKDVIKKHSHYREINRINSPSVSMTHMRFVNNTFSRNNIRCYSNLPEVKVESFYVKDSTIWDRLPSDFINLKRHGSPLSNKIENIEKQIKTFNNFGLFAMADNIKNNLLTANQLKNENSYIGFNKISLYAIVGILLKSNNQTLLNFANVSLSLYNSKNTPNQINDLISNLEYAPEFKNKAAFDRFIIATVSTTDESIMPLVLLGEVDKRLYFITYWYTND